MSAPIVVQHCTPSGARAVTVNDEVVGLVHGDRDLAELLRRAGFDPVRVVQAILGCHRTMAALNA